MKLGSNASRLAVIGAAVATVVALFVLLNGSGDDEQATTTATATQATDEAGEEPAKKPKRKPKPKPPSIPTVEVQGGQPVGGVQELSFKAGEAIEFAVTSDTAQQVHLHGYDVIKDVKPGGRAAFDVPADVEGVFEVELEGPHTPIAQVTVSPG